MNWARLGAIIIGAGVVSSLTDWFFAGDWSHRRHTYPAIWRQGEESRAIALTSPLPFVTQTNEMVVVKAASSLEYQQSDRVSVPIMFAQSPKISVRTISPVFRGQLTDPCRFQELLCSLLC